LPPAQSLFVVSAEKDLIACEGIPDHVWSKFRTQRTQIHNAPINALSLEHLSL